VKGARAKLPRKARLCGAGSFTGRFPVRRQGTYFTVMLRDSPQAGPARLGIVAGRHAVPQAVARTRMKRAVREVFRHLRGSLGEIDVVVKVRRRAAGRQIGEARRELQALLTDER
jgi:ribonuclease P protein component